MSGIISKQIKNKNILFYFDAANLKSYTGTGNTGYSLVLGTTASLLPGVTWSIDSYGVMKFNGTYSSLQAVYTVDSWISCGDRISKLAPTFPITLEAWIRPNKLNGLTTPVGQGVFSLDSTEQYPGSYWGAGMDISSNNGTDTFSISAGYFNGISAGSDGRKSTATVSRVVKAGEWSHIVAVISNSTTILIYYNGETTPVSTLSGTATTMNWSAGVGKTVIGKPSGYYKYILNGDIAMVRAYNSVLSAADVKENYNLHAKRFGLELK